MISTPAAITMYRTFVKNSIEYNITVRRQNSGEIRRNHAFSLYLHFFQVGVQIQIGLSVLTTRFEASNLLGRIFGGLGNDKIK